MKKLILGLLLGALTFAATPAVAQATGSIEGVDLHVYQYPNAATTTLVCDGTDIVTFDNMRVESQVDIVGQGESERFDRRLTLYLVSGSGPRQQVTYIWDDLTRNHSKPAGQAVFEVHQTNQRLDSFTGAKLRWVVTLTGRTSGVSISETCDFTVA